MERTEEQILTYAPIVLVLGREKYNVPVLTIGKAIAWRQKLIATADEIMRPLIKPVEQPIWRKVWNAICFWKPQTHTSADAIFAGLGTAWIAFPEKVLQLIFDYAPDLPQKKILDTATEEEMFLAFSMLSSAVNPIQRQISLLKAVTANRSPSAKFTNSSSPNTAATQAG